MCFKYSGTMTVCCWSPTFQLLSNLFWLTWYKNIPDLTDRKKSDTAAHNIMLIDRCFKILTICILVFVFLASTCGFIRSLTRRRRRPRRLLISKFRARLSLHWIELILKLRRTISSLQLSNIRWFYWVNWVNLRYTDLTLVAELRCAYIEQRLDR